MRIMDRARASTVVLIAMSAVLSAVAGESASGNPPNLSAVIYGEIEAGT